MSRIAHPRQRGLSKSDNRHTIESDVRKIGEKIDQNPQNFDAEDAMYSGYIHRLAREYTAPIRRNRPLRAYGLKQLGVCKTR
jgi:hypothetical protein